MLISQRWRSSTALFLALGITSTTALPAVLAVPAIALAKPTLIGQRFPQSQRVRVPEGTRIPVELENAEKIVVTPEETAPVTLIVASDIRSTSGTILIPAGSKIEGKLTPTDGGTQFIAEELIIKNSNQRLPIDATSQVITEKETIDKGTNVGEILKGAAIGGAAAAIIAEIFGSIDLDEVLGGAGLGALAGLLLGGRKKAEVIVVYPETDLDLTLQSDLVLR
ncbi:MAG TPA: hypothetical protein V6D33_14055 [Cyanophyceae cyanobacterium]